MGGTRPRCLIFAHILEGTGRAVQWWWEGAAPAALRGHRVVALGETASGAVHEGEAWRARGGSCCGRSEEGCPGRSGGQAEFAWARLRTAGEGFRTWSDLAPRPREATEYPEA